MKTLNHTIAAAEQIPVAVVSEEEHLASGGLFEEPEEYFKPESEPTFRSYHRKGCGDEGNSTLRFRN
jgi:hypothetical protein